MPTFANWKFNAKLTIEEEERAGGEGIGQTQCLTAVAVRTIVQ